MFELSLDSVEGMDASQTLAYLADQRAAADAAEARLLLGVAQLADLHPEDSVDSVESLYEEYDVVGAERPVALAGQGTPLVAEFALAALATSLRLTEGAARALMAEVLELRHRLPLCWTRVHDGRLQAWQARRIAQHTVTLTPAQAIWLDRQLAPIAHKVGMSRLLRLIAAAVLQADPGQADADRDSDTQARRVLVTPPTATGIVSVWADLDAPDGHRLDTTLDAGAAALKALGDTSSHDVRRAKTLGLLADPQAALDLLQGRTPGTKTELVVYVHLDQAHLAGDRGTATVEGIPGLRALPLQTIRDWAPSATITVKPVIDCNQELTAPGYRPTAAQVEQAMLKDPTCVFPWCDKPGRNHDLDHITEYDDTGPPDQTRSSNLARLCRFHHRVKTHNRRWRYRRQVDGSYLWTNPYNELFRVDPTGTTFLGEAA